jgi:hypothetical protein
VIAIDTSRLVPENGTRTGGIKLSPGFTRRSVVGRVYQNAKRGVLVTGAAARQQDGRGHTGLVGGGEAGRAGSSGAGPRPATSPGRADGHRTLQRRHHQRAGLPQPARVYTVRTMGAYTGGGPDLVWYGAAGDRTKASISSFGILDDYHGALVRDDYGGYLSYDTDLDAVQQCVAHALRYLNDAHAIDPTTQGWAAQVADALREAIHAVNTARARGKTSLHPRLLDRLRATYDAGVAVEISTNLSRRWHKGNHPACNRPAACNAKPTRSGSSPPASTSPPPTTGRRPPRLQDRRQDLRLLAHPDHPPTPLPHPLLPDHRPQPRPPSSRRHHRRPHQQHLDAPNASLINRQRPLTGYPRTALHSTPWTR